MSKITYDNKVDLQVASNIANINKVTASDMNEIKSAVNDNDDNITTIDTSVGDITTLTTTDKTSVVNAINELDTNQKKIIAISNTQPTNNEKVWIQAESKNLLDYRNFQTKTVNGINIVNNRDGTFTINGTASNNVSEVVSDVFIPMSRTWRMLGCPSGGSSSTYMLSAYVGYWGEGSPNIDTGSGTNITYTGNVKIRFFIKSGTTCNNLIFKPMLTTDTSTTINNFAPKGPNIYALINGQYQIV